MYQRFSPIGHLFGFGPFIKSPATCHFRSLWFITEVHNMPTLVVGRQLIRPPWDHVTKRSDENCFPSGWGVDYDDLQVAFAKDLYDVGPLEALLSQFVSKNGVRYGREVLVVAARVSTEDEPIGIVTDEKLVSYMDQHARTYFVEYADDEYRIMRARGITGQ